MTTFEVDDVQPLIDEPYGRQEVSDALDGRLEHLEIEAASGGDLAKPTVDLRWEDEPVEYVGSPHPFVNAVHLAFDAHLPLALRPDDLWLCIAQGFAVHVGENAEELRGRFVDHEGQEYIEIRRDNFVKGSPDNDWAGCFDEFSDEIAERVGQHNRDLVVGDFSTTGPVERAVSEVVLMDAMSSYFTYGVRTCCGFPRITLEGKPDDWQSVRDRALVLSEFGLEWWTDELVPVLDQVVRSAEGNPDPEFWRSLYKQGGGSGGPYVTGWINTLFPYLPQPEGWAKNPYVPKWGERMGGMCGGPNSGDFPRGLSEVDVKWHYYAQEFDMQFVGGFVGVDQDPDDLCLRPAMGWAVGEVSSG